MKLIAVLSFCFFSAIAVAQQPAPKTPSDACKPNDRMPLAVKMSMCEAMGRPDEVAAQAKKAGQEVSIVKTADGRTISYFKKDPKTGERKLVGTRLVIIN